MTSLRIAMVVPYDLVEEGGVKRHATHVAAALRRRGDHVTLIGPSSAPVREDGVVGFTGVINIGGNGSDNRLGLLASPRQLRAFFRDHAFDVVHVHEPLLPALPYWSALMTRRAAHVATFHGYAEHESFGMRIARTVAAPFVFPWFQRAIAVSEPARRFAARVWRQPIALIPNGVPTSIYRPRPDVERAGEDVERAGFAPARTPLRLLFVGHYRDERKGLPHLLAALALLAARGVPVMLDVVGSGPALAAPGVTFHGPINDERSLAAHYRGCDLFVAPATGQESFGIVLLEAMASARPIACSDIAGFREVVGGDGAAFVPAGDAAALAAAIATLAPDPQRRHAMGRANRARAERFDWEPLAASIRDQYVLAVADRRAARERVVPSAQGVRP